jgi:hypothetical protein
MSVAALAIRECGLRGELTSEARKEGRMPLQTKDRAPLAKPTLACHMPAKGALTDEEWVSTRNASNTARKSNLGQTSGTMIAPAQIAEFLQSMPARYAQAFDAAAIEQHARISVGRRGRPVNVGAFASSARTGTASFRGTPTKHWICFGSGDK